VGSVFCEARRIPRVGRLCIARLLVPHHALAGCWRLGRVCSQERVGSPYAGVRGHPDLTPPVVWEFLILERWR